MLKEDKWVIYTWSPSIESKRYRDNRNGPIINPRLQLQVQCSVEQMHISALLELQTVQFKEQGKVIMESVNIVAWKNLNGYRSVVMLGNRQVKPVAFIYNTQLDSKMPDSPQWSASYNIIQSLYPGSPKEFCYLSDTASERKKKLPFLLFLEFVYSNVKGENL